MQSQFLAAINQLCDEKNLSREVILETVKAALRSAYRKDYGNREQNIEVDLNADSGNAVIYLVKLVVKDKEFENENTQIKLKDAKKYKKDAKVADVIQIDVTPTDFRRIAAQSAKQVIIQRIQEAERDVMYDTFKNRENELLNALVHRVENSQVYIYLEKITTILPPDQQIPGERYYGGQRLKIYLDKVIKTPRGPQLLISRTHPNLVAKLLELEIPEIKSGLVLIKGIAREPGVRCKVAVTSSDPKIDPIGSCVGQKGVRIQNVMDELSNERIDIIQWSDDSERFIKAALAPAKIAYIYLDHDRKRASVFVNTDQRPLAIGKKGQNVQLASKLCGWEIDILDISELKEEQVTAGAPLRPSQSGEKQEVTLVKDLSGVSEELALKLEAAGLTQVSQLKGLSVKDMSDIGIDVENAEKLVEAVKKVK